MTVRYRMQVHMERTFEVPHGRMRIVLDGTDLEETKKQGDLLVDHLKDTGLLGRELPSYSEDKEGTAFGNTHTVHETG